MLTLAVERGRVAKAPPPAFVPPLGLLEHRRLELDRSRRRGAVTEEQRWAHFERRCRLEVDLLEGATPAMCWRDIVVRAELTSHWRHSSFNSWVSIDDDDVGKLLPHRSFAELMVAILALGNVPPLLDEADEPADFNGA